MVQLVGLYTVQSIAAVHTFFSCKLDGVREHSQSVFCKILPDYLLNADFSSWTLVSVAEVH